ncbi:hypothetical protein Tco_0997065, partial [Tanacetum coccineum]
MHRSSLVLFHLLLFLKRIYIRCLDATWETVSVTLFNGFLGEVDLLGNFAQEVLKSQFVVFADSLLNCYGHSFSTLLVLTLQISITQGATRFVDRNIKDGALLPIQDFRKPVQHRKAMLYLIWLLDMKSICCHDVQNGVKELEKK